MKKILIVMTNHSTIGKTNIKNGTFIKEVTHFLYSVINKKLHYEIASIKGGNAPIYGEEITGDNIHEIIYNNKDFQRMIKDTKTLSSLNPDDYTAVFYPGGFGLLSDLAINKDVGDFAAKLYENGGFISAVCHGPACLLPIFLKNGRRLLEKISVTGFSIEEEELANSIGRIPLILEKELTLYAKNYSKSKPLSEFVIQDKRVITGQNPNSAYAVGKKLVENLI